MIYTLNLTYNVEEAKEYLNALQKDFMHLHWYYEKNHNDPRGIGSKNNLNDIHGWGLQTIYADLSFPYHCDIDPHDEGPEYFKDTELVFGFFKKLKEQFVKPYRSFQMTFPPNCYIGKWIPGGPAHGKVFIPITTNDNCILVSEHGTVNLELGKIYLFDMTTYPGEFKNNGDAEISFITFNIPADTFEHTLNLKGII
jgi:hypothetical protein